MEGKSMERTVGTSLLLQMMRNRVYEVEEEYYLYLNKVEDKLLKYETVSIGEWEGIFKGSNLSQDEYENFKKIWIEGYVRYYFFRRALKDLPNTTDINTVRRIVTIDDFAYPEILKMKLAYVYGNKIQEYESIIERWTSDEYVTQWLKYETYRKIGDYWDMDFASDHSAFDSVYKYNRASIEGLDSVESVLESAKNFNDLKNVLLFTFYTYNSMLLPRVSADYVKAKYSGYCKGKEKSFLKYLDEIPSSMATLNAYSLRVIIQLNIIKSELSGKDRITSDNKLCIKSVLGSLLKCIEIYSNKVIKDSYYYLIEFTEDDVYAFRSATGFSIKKKYLVYEMKHCKEFPAELVPEFAEVDAEEFTENEFYKIAGELWRGCNPLLKRIWFEAVMRGFYIPVYMKEKLGQFCNTNELLMNFTANDLIDREIFLIFIYNYLTDTNNWNLVKDTVIKVILNNQFRGFWYAYAIDEIDNVLLSKSILARNKLYVSLDLGKDICNPYLVSNDRFSICSTKLYGEFIDVVNLRLFLESRLYGNTISIDEVKNYLRDYPEYITDAFLKVIDKRMTKFSKESLDLIIDCLLDFYLKHEREDANYIGYRGLLDLKNEALKSFSKQNSISNSKAADIFFGKA